MRVSLGGAGLRGLMAVSLTALTVVAAALPSPRPRRRPGAAAAPKAAGAERRADRARSQQLLSVNRRGQELRFTDPRASSSRPRGSFVQANPDLIRDLREVATQLIPQHEGRRGEINDVLARTYASQFSEAELKELIAFYGTPVGKKLVERRQVILDGGMRGVQAWSAASRPRGREQGARRDEEARLHDLSAIRRSPKQKGPAHCAGPFCFCGLRASTMRSSAPQSSSAAHRRAVAGDQLEQHRPEQRRERRARAGSARSGSGTAPSDRRALIGERAAQLLLRPAGRGSGRPRRARSDSRSGAAHSRAGRTPPACRARPARGWRRCVPSVANTRMPA